MALERRKAPVSGSMAPNPSWVDPYFADQYPSLHSFLNDVQYSDGTTRLTGGLVVFVKLSVLTFAINDNDRNLVAYINPPTWEEGLALIDQGIKDDSLPWRARAAKQNSQLPPF